MINTAAGHGGPELVRVTHVSEHYPGHLHGYTVALTGEVLVTDTDVEEIGVGNG